MTKAIKHENVKVKAVRSLLRVFQKYNMSISEFLFLLDREIKKLDGPKYFLREREAYQEHATISDDTQSLTLKPPTSR